MYKRQLLSDLVAQALRANTSVNSAQAALQQARALRDVTAAALLPTVDSSASAQRSRADGHSANPVSYTHLTLPTSDLG